MKKIILKPGNMDLGALRVIAASHVPVTLDRTAYTDIARGRRVVADIIAKGKTVYGINTGFGELAKVRIKMDDLETLQRNLILSHATGVGDALDDTVMRLLMILKINGLAQGASGVRRDVVDMLLALYNAQIYPVVPSKGSVGASGDLAPLAHLALPLIGEGQVRAKGRVQKSADALKKAGLKPLTLAAKEGLALINGTQVSTALALGGYFKCENAYAAAIVAGALSTDAAKGSTVPFDPVIHRLRRQAGQIDVAKALGKLMTGSAIRASHDNDDDDRVQDPYCLRCQPQVMGAVLDQLRAQSAILEREANAVTDNPIVDVKTGKIVSGGNFHAEPVAVASDALGIAISETGAISERRIAMMIDAKFSRLPPFLVKNAGLNSGFMIAHVTAAALASENKTLAHPASVDSLPTSANQEDHVSMATFAARKLNDIAWNVAHIVAIELLAAAQGIDFHAPLKTSPSLIAAHKEIRAHVPVYNKDRLFAPDIEKIADLVLQGAFLPHAGRGLLPSVS